ncbi:hypothetical protein BC629DRAFT_1600011 [Irpex lacteus]|nr:hypothetical protein BC629DRAFT_1600011 [Irpex lacteus]
MRSPGLFKAVVLELIKLVQAALAICAYGKSADPTCGAALLSLVLTAKSAEWSGSTSPKTLSSILPPLSKPSTLHGGQTARSLALDVTSPPYTCVGHQHEPRKLFHAVITATRSLLPHKGRLRSYTAPTTRANRTSRTKVHRVLINKLDDLATDLRTNPDPDTRKGSFSSASNLTRRPNWTSSDGVKSSEDEMDFMGGIPGREVQRKLESWAAIGRGKKSSVDFGGRVKGLSHPSADSPHSLFQHYHQSSFRGTKLVNEVCIIGQVSPVSDTHTKNPFRLGVDGLSQARRSSGELSDYDRKVTEFNQRNPYEALRATPYRQLGRSSNGGQRFSGDEEESRLRRGPSPAPDPSRRRTREGEETFQTQAY